MKELSVLVVDDDDKLRDLLPLMLEPVGHTVTCARDGAEAVRMLDRQNFDLVITDIMMPEMDGIELIPKIRTRQPATRIVAVSGGGKFFTTTSCLQIAKTLDAHAVVMKPFNRDQLLAGINLAFPNPGLASS